MIIKIQRTVQAKQYCPITVSVEEEAECKTNEEYEEFRERLSAILEDVLARELEKARNQ